MTVPSSMTIEAEESILRRDSTIAVLIVLGAMALGWLLHGYVIATSREAVRLWVVSIEGGLTAGAVVTAWQVARERRTAAIGLAAAGVVVIVGAAGLVDLAGWLIASSLGWAVIVTLVIRLVKPAPAQQPDRTPASAGDSANRPASGTQGGTA